MVTLQDISIQLMKPAKDLADWKFPLSQILEEYYALLEEPCSVNFGEAALVLQNSTNVYVRRIERLFSETEFLRQTFLVYEEEEIKSASKEKKASKKAYVDFENFVIVDLEKDIGKNIDKKNRYEAQKKVKLLSHRFTQLESNTAQLCVPVQTHDVLGEIIGKKYDFRCNQTVNTNGMLVDELTPYDFARVHGSRVRKERISLSSCSEPKTPATRTSGYHSATPLNDNESVMSNREGFEDDNYFLQLETNSPLNDLTITEENEKIPEKENMMNGDCDVSAKETCEQNSDNQELSTAVSVEESDQTKNKCQNENSEETNEVQEECQKNDKAIEKSEASNTKQTHRVSKEDQLKKGNQTKKTLICSPDGINERDWKPMPLTQGTDNVLSSNSSVLKIPDYISRLQTKFGPKKRKLASSRRKPESLTKFVLRESESLGKKEECLVPQTKRKFKRLRRQELDDFMKNLDECLNSTEKEIDTVRCEAVTGVTIDLLGFRISQNQDDFIKSDIEDSIRSASPVDVELESRIRHNSLNDTPISPNTYNDWQEPPEISETDLTLPDYQTLIEDKMKEIFKESDVATELDQTVAKWHASLHEKLSQAEVRSTFRIHDYASRIIKSLQALDQKKTSFDNIVQDLPAYEVARYFLASLQLANSYDVEIKTEDNDSSIQIMLLNDGKNNERS